MRAYPPLATIRHHPSAVQHPAHPQWQLSERVVGAGDQKPYAGPQQQRQPFGGEAAAARFGRTHAGLRRPADDLDRYLYHYFILGKKR